MPRSPFPGLRVLVAEDQMLIALAVTGLLSDLGYVVVGPVSSLAETIHLAHTEALDAAVLDVNLDGGWVFPAAEVLQSRNIPFVFVSGYGEKTFPEKWRHLPRLGKPFADSSVAEFLRNAISANDAKGVR